MTIQELITALSQYPSEAPVVVRGYEGGYNDIHSVEPLSIQLNVNKTEYYGAHGPNDSQPQTLPDVPLTPVVYLHSYNHLADED